MAGIVNIVTPGVVSIGTIEELKQLAESVEGVKGAIVNDLSGKGQQDHVNPFHNIG